VVLDVDRILADKCGQPRRRPHRCVDAPRRLSRRKHGVTRWPMPCPSCRVPRRNRPSLW
jgi:hypothetical protein